MELSWFESLIFGFISGLTRFLPVSAQAHEALMLKLFGGSEEALMKLAVHAATLVVLFMNLRQHISKLLRERELLRIPPRRRKRQPDRICVLELKLLRTAMFTALCVTLMLKLLMVQKADLSLIALFLIINGIVLYIPGHIPNGNKDARSMSSFDGILLGLSGAAGAIPGFSQVSCCVSAGIIRGADKENSLRWALLLSFPALLLSCGLDIFGLFTVGAVWSFPVIIKCVLAATAAFGGANIAISTMQFLAVRVGFSGFAYYCWGAALFSFLIYLTI